MTQFFENLKSMGYSDCFYQNGKLWGFQQKDVMPTPISQEVIQSAESESQRTRISERLKHWCDDRGIPRPKTFS